MKRLLSVLAVIVLIFSLCGCEEGNNYPTATEKFYVNDFAGVISASAEDELFSKAAALDKATTAQVVVVTVKSLGGEEPSDYALELGRRWGVGTKEDDNGIVILLSSEDREIYIAVGYGLEGALPDSKTGRIIDVYGLESLRNNDFSNGLLSIGNAVINEVYLEYGIEPEEGYVPIEMISASSDDDDGAIIFWIIMIVIILLFSLGGRRFGIIPWFTGFGGGGSFGGFSGSSGGFSGFSGGGGSFGGGGAGRGF